MYDISTLNEICGSVDMKMTFLQRFGFYIQKEHHNLIGKYGEQGFSNLVGGISFSVRALFSSLEYQTVRLSTVGRAFTVLSVMQTPNINPIHSQNTYKTTGLMGIFHIAPLFYRKFHDFLRENYPKTASLLSIILYPIRLGFVLYELLVGVLLYFPKRLANSFFNRNTPEILSDADVTIIKENVNQFWPDSNKAEKSSTAHMFSRLDENIKHKNKYYAQMENDVEFISHAFDNAAISGNGFFLKNQQKQVILSAATDGLLGEKACDEGMKFYAGCKLSG